MRAEVVRVLGMFVVLHLLLLCLLHQQLMPQDRHSEESLGELVDSRAFPSPSPIPPSPSSSSSRQSASRTIARSLEPIPPKELFQQSQGAIERAASEFGTLLDGLFAPSAGIPMPGQMFAQCYINTLKTTTTVHSAADLKLQNQV